MANETKAPEVNASEITGNTSSEHLQDLMANATLTNISLSNLIPDEAALRKTVEKNKREYQELLASVLTDWVIKPILVRPHPNQENTYILIDGLHRFEAASEAAARQGISLTEATVPCRIISVHDKLDVYRLQLSANIQKVETKPVQILEHIQFMLAESEGRLTQTDIAKMINKSQGYISQILKLRKLVPEAKERVDSNKITASNAFQLAKLPEEEQREWIDRAEEMDASDFATQVAVHLSNLRKEKKQRVNPDEFTPIPKLLKKDDILDLIDNLQNNELKQLDEETFTERAEELKSLREQGNLPQDFILGMYYAYLKVVQMDQDTLEQQRIEHEAKVAARQRERSEKEAAKLADKAAESGVNILMPKGAATPIGL